MPKPRALLAGFVPVAAGQSQPVPDDLATGVACQFLFCHRQDGEILVDLLTLEPLPVDGNILASGTPLTLGLTDPGPNEDGNALAGLLGRWANGSSVCRVRAIRTIQGQRLSIDGDGDHLVVDVDGRAGIV